MGPPVWTATVNLGSDASGGYYLPGRDPAYYSDGFWIKKDSTSIRAGRYSTTSPAVFSFTFAASNEFGESAVILSPLFPANSTTEKILVGANGDPASGIACVSGSFSPVYDSSVITEPVAGFGSSPYNQTLDYLALLIWPTTSSYPSVACNTIDGTSGLPLTATFIALNHAPPPRPTGNVFSAYYKNSNYLYASWPEGKINVTYRWAFDGVSSPTTAPVHLYLINRKLTGILSDGRLLADTGDGLYVYSPDGVTSFYIPTGSLHFVHERTDGTSWYSVFTRTIQIPDQTSGNSDYRIEIYEVKTADLQNLSN
jgi:hypothetical protein